jgi:hypothetical protein
VASLQIKNVPADLYRKVQRHAKRQGTTLRDFVLAALRKEIIRAEFQRRLARRAPVELRHRATRALEEIRAQRNREIDS